MAIDFNTEPFFDDYNEDKNFYKILFRPGTAVQARELTQLQTILQQQIKRHGDHVFKDGAMVIPGQVAYDLDVKAVILANEQNTNYTTLLSELDGQFITNVAPDSETGELTGVVAKVVATSLSETVTENGQSVTYPNLVYIKYIAAGENSTEFQAEDILYLTDGFLTQSAQVAPETQEGIWPVQDSSIATVSRGVYYIKGYFVLVEDQTIILDRYNNTPSYRVGLSFTEDVIYPEEDESLLDNALGSPNYSAPGAARYEITLNLTKLELSSTEVIEDFIDLLRLDNGKVIFKLSRTEYAELEKTLARRTFDESGDYTLKPFTIRTREYRSNNRGSWEANTAYVQGDIIRELDDTALNQHYFMCTDSGISGSNKPTFSSSASVIEDNILGNAVSWEYVAVPIFNDGVYKFDSSDSQYSSFTVSDHDHLSAMLVYAIDPSKAYVKGYEIEKQAVEYVSAYKSRDIPEGSSALCTYFGLPDGSLPAVSNSVSTELEATVDLSMGSYVIVENVEYSPILTTYGISTPFATVSLHNDTVANTPTSATKIGTARIRGIEYHSTGQYKIFLFDIKMSGNHSFEETISIYDNETNLKFRCDMIRTEVTTGVFKTILQNPESFSLLYSLPDQMVKEITDATYAVSYQFFATTGTSATEFTHIAPTGTSWDSVSGTGNYIVIDQTNGDIITNATLDVAGTTLTVSGLSGSTTYSVISTLIVDTTTPETLLTIPDDAKDYFLTESAAAPISKVYTLNHSYLTRVISVKMNEGDIAGGKTTFDNPPDGGFSSQESAFTIDITRRFSFDLGHYDTHIAAATMTLLPGESLPNAPIMVRYEYIAPLSGDAEGKFFTVESYTHESSKTTYGEIRSYNGSSFRDCLDFRPYESNGILYDRTLPKFGRNAIINYKKYLPRTDNISLNTKGKYIVSYGIPNVYPKEPGYPTDAMKLAVSELDAYTLDTSQSINITRVENKRYTMRDIGKLERRIEDLEYYTALSLLEADTNSLNVTDADGNDRFKNGFLVDSFNGQGIGNAASPEWNASIDSKNQELRPFFNQRQVSLLELINGGTDYAVSGDIITAPLASTPEVSMISQTRASKDISVNPYDMYTFKGLMFLNPWSDTWFSTARRPDIVINDDGQYNAVVSKAEEDGVLGTVWNAWQVVNVGTPQTIGQRLDTISSAAAGNRFARIDTELINSNSAGVGNGPFWRSRSSFTSEELNAIGIFDGRLSGSFANSVAGSRVITFDVDATEITSSRTGKRTFIQDRVDSRVVDDRVVETTMIPYIRPRAVLFNAIGLKPYSYVNAFFDGIDVNDYIERAQTIRVGVISGYSSKFDTTRNCGSNVQDSARVVEMPSYGQGTIDVTNNSTTVIGTSTGFSEEFRANDFIIIGDDEYKIASITDDTTLVLDTAYTGTTAEQIAYKRRIPGTNTTEVEVAFNHGEVITNITAGGATAIVVGQEIQKVNATTSYVYLHILNVKRGTRSTPWVNGDVLEGEYSDTEGNSTKPRVTYLAKYSSLNKNKRVSPTGQYHGLFRIPNNPLNRFKTGVRELVFTDTTDPKQSGTTDARALYEAHGVLETKQRTIISTRTANLAVEQLDPEQDTIIQTNERLVRDTGWFDPLAQTFLVQEDGGAFLSSVDLYFSATDNNIPVRIEVREVVNGYPGQKVLPFSRVEKRPAEIFTSSDGSVVTNFKFQSPIYVQDSTEYALVVLSDSAAYRIHASEAGATDYSGKIIAKQEYNGVLFKSQNASAWTASQMEDMKFNIYKAQFNTSASSSVNFVVPRLSLCNLQYNPLYFREGSNKIRVIHRNHGFVVGEEVILSTRQQVSTIDNWNASDIFGAQCAGRSHTIISVEEDAYVIRITTDVNGDPITTVASATGRIGGAYIYASENYEFSTAMIDVAHTAVSGTNVEFVLETFGRENPLVAGERIKSTTIIDKENYDFDDVQVLRYSPLIAPETDVVLTANLSTTNPNLTPVLDTGRMSITTVNNKVDNPRATTINDEDLDTLSLATEIEIIETDTPADANFVNLYTGTTDTIFINDDVTDLDAGNTGKKLAIYNNLSQLLPGSTVRFAYGQTYMTYFVKTSDVISDSGVNTRYITFTTEDFTSVDLRETVVDETVNIDWLSHYNSEIAPQNGSVTSAYVTKKINLSRSSEMLRIMLSALIPSKADIEVYYKVGQSVDADLASVAYTRAAPSSAYVKSEKAYTDLEFDIEGLPAFTSIIVKIVMRSTSIAKVPRIKDLRVIACA